MLKNITIYLSNSMLYVIISYLIDTFLFYLKEMQHMITCAALYYLQSTHFKCETNKMQFFIFFNCMGLLYDCF